MKQANKYLAKGLYACILCGIEHFECGPKSKRLPCSCGGQVEYFGSHKEYRTYINHVCMQKAGVIKNLQPHPRYELVVNGITVGHYTADLQYRDTDTHKLHVKDTKGGNSQRGAAASDSRLRMRIAEAIYSFKVDVV